MAKASSAPSDAQPKAGLPPIERRALTDDVITTLRKAILAGAFAPGDRLPEAATAGQLRVSRVPVREAMLQLEREGLLTFDSRGCASVRALNPVDFEEIFSLRLTLEPLAIELACRHRTELDLELLEANLARTRKAARLLEVTLLDVEFHDLIMRASRHSRLLRCWLDLKPQLEVWLHRMHRHYETETRRTRETTVREHARLLAQLRARKADAAANRMRQHTAGWRELLNKLATSQKQ